MKKILQILILSLFCLPSLAQEEITNELENAYMEEKYDFIISKHSEKVNEYPAKAIYYVAMAYYMKANDNKALELMNLSIDKDNTDPDAYFIKGATLNYMEQFENAIESFTQAIKLDSTNSNYFSGLGDSYLSMELYDKALDSYIDATQKVDPIERPFAIIPQLYTELNQPEKALEAYYISKERLSEESEYYIMTLYNIGLYEYLKQEYDKSEIAFTELIELAPSDFHSYAKLIQVYYGKKEYEKAAPYREKLYEAYNKGILKDNLKEMFCFDQFNWEDKSILAFEKFATKEGELYYKHVFYVKNETGKTEFTIQTENSPISAELGGPKYAIGMSKEDSHSTFRFIEENFEYDELKSIIIQILEQEINAVSSSTFERKEKQMKKKRKKKKNK